MFKKIKFILFFALILFLCISCAQNEPKPAYKNAVFPGNIQNGGYFVECENGYIYFDGDSNALCKKDTQTNTVEIIAKGSCFYDLNLYNDYIYYTSGSPGNIWKISVDGKHKKKLTQKRAEHLVVYDDHIYFCLFEDDDWDELYRTGLNGGDLGQFNLGLNGTLYRTDLNGKNSKLLAQCVQNFCIVDDRIYYTDVETEPKLRGMKTDGTDVITINQAYPCNLFSIENKLLYSDYNREGKLFSYDLNTNAETCICQDVCLSANANEKWIFYTNISEKGDLYRIRPDGSEREKLVDGNIVNIHVIGNSVFYREFSNMHEFERIDIE
ncbi:MAG: DUF5050 domain-containing protein [Ruminococcaceae bacterium]|nr:DUF5050 domain-containing protein [Oscillospiraceae bacterium]